MGAPDDVVRISTHAPRTGSDVVGGVPCCCCVEFQPTLPARGATPACSWMARHTAFQPTLPARGATPCPGQCKRPAHPISTHAPRTGSDCKRSAPSTSTQKFQPTLPARGATRGKSHFFRIFCISTHAPRTGSDRNAQRNNVPACISTHAPRTGSDVIGGGREHHDYYFNPRSPHGERLRLFSRFRAAIEFQPTLPARGATWQTCSATGCQIFQPTLPARGATALLAEEADKGREFQPTLPARGATVGVSHFFCWNAISTHAPRTGSDKSNQQGKQGGEVFQPTLPARGATRSFSVKGGNTMISTHAPRTGSDSCRCF